VIAADSPSIEGTYILLFGFISLKIKQRWYLGEACMFALLEDLLVADHD
jgi:hypothetical protein